MKPRRLVYVGNESARTETGKDDPSSPGFVPLEERTEAEKARFWDKWSKRKDRRAQVGVF